MLSDKNIHKEAFINVFLGAFVSMALTYFMIAPLFRHTDLSDGTITVISAVVFGLASHLRYYIIRAIFQKKSRSE